MTRTDESPMALFESIATKVLRSPQFRTRNYSVADLQARRKGRSTAMHREIVRACAMIARELSARGWAQHAIAAVFHREHSTVGLWLREKEVEV